MKKILILLFVIQTTYLYSFSQIENKLLEIYSITEYIDGYIIKGVNESKSDTLSIISLKGTLVENIGCEKLIVGNKYNFKIKNLVSQMAALPPENFVIRIKTTIIWKNGDRLKDIPVFSENLNGLYIRMD